MGEAIGVISVLAVLILASLLISQYLMGYLTREPRAKESEMGPAPKHLRSPIPDQFAEASGMPSESWQATHHVYEALSFEDDTALFAWLSSADRPGRREDWKITAPEEARFALGGSEVSAPAFTDWYLDAHMSELTK